MQREKDKRRKERRRDGKERERERERGDGEEANREKRMSRGIRWIEGFRTRDSVGGDSGDSLSDSLLSFLRAEILLGPLVH